MDFLADTTFLVDLWREQQRPGPAMRFAAQHADASIAIAWVTAGEFLAGSISAGHDAGVVSAFLAHFSIVQSGREIITRYAELFAHLRKTKNLPGPNDLWIAAAALALGAPVLTRNARDFRRVPDLQVIDYTSA